LTSIRCNCEHGSKIISFSDDEYAKHDSSRTFTDSGRQTRFNPIDEKTDSEIRGNFDGMVGIPWLTTFCCPNRSEERDFQSFTILKNQKVRPVTKYDVEKRRSKSLIVWNGDQKYDMKGDSLNQKMAPTIVNASALNCLFCRFHPSIDDECESLEQTVWHFTLPANSSLLVRLD
jgi:hypothetical protein